MRKKKSTIKNKRILKKNQKVKIILTQHLYIKYFETIFIN